MRKENISHMGCIFQKSTHKYFMYNYFSFYIFFWFFVFQIHIKHISVVLKKYKRLKNIWKSNIIVETDEKQKSHNWNILWLRIKEAKDFVVRHQSDHQWRCCVPLLMRIWKRIRQIPYGMKFLNLKKHMKFLRTILSSSFQIHVSI